MTEEVFPFITDPAIHHYCVMHSSHPSPLQVQAKNLSEKTGQIKLISDHFLGQYLKIMSQVLAPKKILEIGTFTGYGTLCLMEGLQADGQIYTLESNSDWSEYSAQNLASTGRKHQVKQLLGDAAQLIPTLKETWDLVFIDAAKRQYNNYLDLVLPQVRIGGVILADNVLWKGKMGHPNNDKLGKGLDAFNKRVFNDENLDNIILPIDDGLNFIIKTA